MVRPDSLVLPGTPDRRGSKKGFRVLSARVIAEGRRAWEEHRVSNPATGGPTEWDEPLPDLTNLVWEELRGSGSRPALNGVIAILEERTRAPERIVALYEDEP